jgi:hypothetical protein
MIPIDRRLCLLIGRCARVRNIFGTLFTLILNRVEQQMVAALKDWQHLFTASGSPSTQNHRYLVNVYQSLGQARKCRPVALPIFLYRYDLESLITYLNAARRIYFCDCHQLCLSDRMLRNR